jgi:hypothetical protein
MSSACMKYNGDMAGKDVEIVVTRASWREGDLLWHVVSSSQEDDSTMMVEYCGYEGERNAVSLGHPPSPMTRRTATPGDVHLGNR